MAVYSDDYDTIDLSLFKNKEFIIISLLDLALCRGSLQLF